MRPATWLTTGVCAACWVLVASLELHYGFSDCVDNKRTLFYYSPSKGTCLANSTGEVLSKPPVRGLRCDIHCGQGFYLGANFSGPEPVSGCERCPEGKYSLGGGALFSQRTNAWSVPLSAELQSDCVTRNMFTGRWEHNCHPWAPSIDGSSISSGANSRVMENFQGTRLFSTLRISATFVRNGSVTYKYRVDAEPPYDGLIFQIDDARGAELISQSDGWKEAVVPVAAGAHTLVWNYMKDYTGDAGEDKAYIKVIELVGTAWSDLHCHSCGGDMTNNGGSLCAFCGPNEYAAAKSNSELDFTCNPCPPNMYAPKGSIGISSCVEQRPCSIDDVNETYTACKDGARNVTYAWIEPQTCDLTLQKSIELPRPLKGVECASCARGYKPAQGDECSACAAGQAMTAIGDCKACPAGMVVVNALEYGVGTPDGWSSWPQIIDAERAQHAGWKLSKSGVRFAQHTDDEEGAEFWSQPSRSVLSFVVPFIHSGSLNLTYQLSNVPTSANSDSRAWVELEIRDADDGLIKVRTKIDLSTAQRSGNDSGNSSRTKEDESIVHLLHGSENGTFNEVVPVNVTGLIRKEFSFVVRASSAMAKRAIEARLLFLGFTGTQEGAGVDCGRCPPGYEPALSDDGQETKGCRICPSGTFAKAVESSETVACVECPANWYSREGSAECIPCGTNTYSKPGAMACAAPQVLTLNASSSSESITLSPSSSSSPSGSVASALDGLQVTYNLSLLEALVWGNRSWILDDTVYGNATSLQSTKPVESTLAFQVDSQNYWFPGIFRPLGSSWLQQVPGQIVDQQVDTSSEVAYVVLASTANPREAGNLYQQNSPVYGNVMCSAPAQWKLMNGGSHIDILPLESGAGVKVSLTGGSPCGNGKMMSTTFNFVCDLRSGTTSEPASASKDDNECNWNVVWKTAYACPICDEDYFNELRSTCNGGEQLVSYARKLACYGGSKSESTDTISACTESAVVLDTTALYSVYAAVVIVGFVVLLLMMAILIVHRKYRNAYNDYMYLKAKLPTEENTQEDGSKETVFEFTPKSNALHSSPLGTMSPSVSSGQDALNPDADDDGVELKLRSA